MRSARLALVAFLLLACWQIVARAEGGVVQGQVVNGTEGGAITINGLPVRLYLFSGGALKDTRRAITDAQGKFRFEGLPTGSGWSALATVEYAGIEYESGALDLSSGADLNADVAVYETTTDDSALKIEQRHLIVEMGPGQLEVTEYLILANTGDHSYIGSQEVIPNRRATARLALPSGATDVSFDPPELASALVRTGQGLVDTRPVIPGRQEYMLSYVLPVEGPTYNLLLPVLYPVDALDVLLNVPGAEVSAPSLERGGMREASGTTYLYFAGHSLNRGNDVALRLSGLGRPAPPAGETTAVGAAAGIVQRGWGWESVPLATLVALGGLLIVRLRRGLFVESEQAAAAVETERKRLLAAIVDLDERYEAGEVEESAYRRQRQAKKKRLLNLVLGLQSRGMGRESAGAGRARASARRTDVRRRKEVRAHPRPVRRRPEAG